MAVRHDDVQQDRQRLETRDAPSGPHPREPGAESGISVGALLVLLRVAGSSGATRSDVTRDLGGYVSGRRAEALLAGAIRELSEHALIEEHRHRLKATAAGSEHVKGLFGSWPKGDDWIGVRDGRLIALALGEPRMGTLRLKRLARPDGLRSAIVRQRYQLPHPRRPDSAARLRSELAVVALRRAFGDRIGDGLDVGDGFNARTARVLAGQLLAVPRDLGTDARLIATLAAEAVAADRADPATLRLALVRSWISGGLNTGDGAAIPVAEREDALSAARTATPSSHPTAGAPASVAVSPSPSLSPSPGPSPGPSPSPCPSPAGQTTGPRHPAASRPDLPGFARIVLQIASGCAEGWAGNRKAFVSHVWERIVPRHPEWGLTEIEFKAMLAEAHRTGHLVLANADIKMKSRSAELQSSAIAYKNTVWHFIRVEN